MKFNFHKNLLYHNTEITLKINKTGIQSFISNIHIQDNEIPYPYLIFLNDEVQNLTLNTQLNITKQGSIVKLIWNTPLKSLRCLFCHCGSITEINFTSLDTSSLTYMGGIFNGCTSLISVDLSKINTKNATAMRYMFLKCNSIK